ncbi:hypothetical protein TNCV_1936231 [Trichonephila clavipes]|nr:hypothetical protein TNCV_1936231 [Trichonephila clavipes]
MFSYLILEIRNFESPKDKDIEFRKEMEELRKETENKTYEIKEKPKFPKRTQIIKQNVSYQITAKSEFKSLKQLCTCTPVLEFLSVNIRRIKEETWLETARFYQTINIGKVITRDQETTKVKMRRRVRLNRDNISRDFLSYFFLGEENATGHLLPPF